MSFRFIALVAVFLVVAVTAVILPQLGAFHTDGYRPVSFEDCQNQPGSRTLESFPAQCITAQGESFTQPAPAPTPTPSASPTGM